MKTLVVANPRAGHGRVGKHWARYERRIFDCLGSGEVRKTKSPGEATYLVRNSIHDGYERIVVVGGDGTINEVVNGFIDENGQEVIGKDVTLVIFPGGTGGDFARSIGLSDKNAEKAMYQAKERRIDLGRAKITKSNGQEFIRHFINISSFGSSGLIVDKVNKSTKIFGGKASFLFGTIKGLSSYQNQTILLKIDDTFEEEVVINTVAIANGRFFGGSMMVAPNAILDDGLFDVVIIGDINMLDFIKNSGKLYSGEHLNQPFVKYFQGKTIEAIPISGDVLIDLDGEQPGKLPVGYQIIPKAINLYAPWHKAVAL